MQLMALDIMIYQMPMVAYNVYIVLHYAVLARVLLVNAVIAEIVFLPIPSMYVQWY